MADAGKKVKLKLRELKDNQKYVQRVNEDDEYDHFTSSW